MDELKKLLETYMDENLEQLILSSPSGSARCS